MVICTGSSKDSLVIKTHVTIKRKTLPPHQLSANSLSSFQGTSFADLHWLVCRFTLLRISDVSTSTHICRRNTLNYNYVSMDSSRDERTTVWEDEIEDYVQHARRDKAIQPVDGKEVCKLSRDMNFRGSDIVGKSREQGYDDEDHDDQRAPVLLKFSINPLGRFFEVWKHLHMSRICLQDRRERGRRSCASSRTSSPLT